MQTTVSKVLVFRGIGLHSGEEVELKLCPAPANFGLCFFRSDVEIGDCAIPARWDRVEQSPLCTKLVNEAGISVSTVEHLLSALAGCGVHNARIEINGPEVPILDGSAVPFVRQILADPLTQLDQPVEAIRILKDIEFKTDQGWARLVPSDIPKMSFHIDFKDAAIGVQSKSINMSNGSFVRELCDSRTFCRSVDVETMRANGLARGGSLENAVVVDGAKVLSPGGLRHADEAVRHKMLDALGDLTLSGAPIIGHYIGHRAGHAITNNLLCVLFATPGSFERVSCSDDVLQILPGIGACLEEYRAAS